MKRICPALLTIILLNLQLFSQPTSSHSPNAKNTAQSDLLRILDSRYQKITTESLIFSYNIPIPQCTPTPYTANAPSKKLYQILDEQENGTKKMPFSLQELLKKKREEYGIPPSNTENIQIQQALSILQNTKFGSEMCKSVAYGCTLESIKKAGIEILVNTNVTPEDPSGYTPNPIDFSGQFLVSLSKRMDGGFENPQFLALIIIHEMSHVEDLKQNKLGTLTKVLYASDEKARIIELAAYDDISRKYHYINDLLDFTLDYFKWKNENGSYPKHQFMELRLGPTGILTPISTEDLIKTYIEPTFPLSFEEGHQNLIHALWQNSYGNPPVNPELVKKIRQVTKEKMEIYKNWRLNPTGAAIQQQTTQTSNSDGSNSNGNNNNGNNNNGNHTNGNNSNSNGNNGQMNPHPVFPDNM